MNKLNKVAVLAFSVWLVGCASTPKPFLVGSGYESFAKEWAFMNYCTQTQKLSFEASEVVKKDINSRLQQYSYDLQSLQGVTDTFYKSFRWNTLTTECADLASKTADAMRRESEASAASRSSPSRETYMPRTTNCATYFGQTHCTSY